MRHVLSRIGLRARIQLLTLGAVLATTGGATGFGVVAARSASRDRMTEKGRVLAGMVARNSEFGLYTRNATELESVVAGLRVDPEVAYVRFVERDGSTLLASRFDGPDPPPPLPAVAADPPAPAA